MFQHTTYKMSRGLLSLLKDLPTSADFGLRMKDESEGPSQVELRFIFNTLRMGLRPYLAKRTLKALYQSLRTDENERTNSPVEVTFFYKNGIVNSHLIDQVLQRIACPSCTKVEASALVQDLKHYFKLVNNFNGLSFFYPSPIFFMGISFLLSILMLASAAFIPISPIIMSVILGISLGFMGISAVTGLVNFFIPRLPHFLLPNRLQSLLSNIAKLEKSIAGKLNNVEEAIEVTEKTFDNHLLPSYEECVKNTAGLVDNILPSYTEATKNLSQLSSSFFKSAVNDAVCQTEQNQNDQRQYQQPYWC